MNTTGSHLLENSQTDEGTTMFARNFIQKYKARMVVQRNLSSRTGNTCQNQTSDTADKSCQAAQQRVAAEWP